MVTLTDTAASKIKELLNGQARDEAGLRLAVRGGGCSGFQYALAFDQ
jgi:iron-sulfur cluster assembly protein